MGEARAQEAWMDGDVLERQPSIWLTRRKTERRSARPGSSSGSSLPRWARSGPGLARPRRRGIAPGLWRVDSSGHERPRDGCHNWNGHHADKSLCRIQPADELCTGSAAHHEPGCAACQPRLTPQIPYHERVYLNSCSESRHHMVEIP